jgi:hypothetical protein
MSFRRPPTDQALVEFDFNISGPEKCLYWVIVPAGFGGRIIIEMVGKGLGQIVLGEVNRCLEESWFLDIWVSQGGFRLEELLICFVMLNPELALLGGFPGEEPPIWADGFIWSSHRRIQLPRFRPTSMSLSWMFRWTLSATSNTACVRLQKEGKITILKVLLLVLVSIKQKVLIVITSETNTYISKNKIMAIAVVQN